MVRTTMSTVAVKVSVISVWFSPFAAAATKNLFFFLGFVRRVDLLAVSAPAVRAFGMGQVAELAHPADSSLAAVAAHHAHAFTS